MPSFIIKLDHKKNDEKDGKILETCCPNNNNNSSSKALALESSIHPSGSTKTKTRKKANYPCITSMDKQTNESRA